MFEVIYIKRERSYLTTLSNFEKRVENRTWSIFDELRGVWIGFKHCLECLIDLN